MAQTLDVLIDETGNVRPVDRTAHLPPGRATLIWDTAGHELYQLSESALSDWLRPEEDEAWAYLQPERL